MARRFMIRKIDNDAKFAPIFSKLGRETFIDAFGMLYNSADMNAFLEDNHSLQDYEHLLQDSAYGLWLAEDKDGKANGYCVAGPCQLPVPDEPKNSGELKRLYMIADNQNAGQGGEMMRLALAWLKDRFEHIYVSVYAENYKAQRFYQRAGFEKIHDYKFMVGQQADPEIIMQLKIDY